MVSSIVQGFKNFTADFPLFQIAPNLQDQLKVACINLLLKFVRPSYALRYNLVLLYLYESVL